tara:strand:+ start:490 stop:723 length:234 start_codon:yes stop_codon:yes gene_type:complete
MAEEDKTMKETIEQVMRKMHLEGKSEEILDSFLYGVLQACHAAGVDTPTIWTVNYMCGRVDRLYMTDDEWNAINAEY